MGWQDRDWAKLDDDELGAIYGGGGRREPGRKSSVRRTLKWSALVLVAALAGAYVLSRPSPSSPSLNQRPTSIFGHAITFGGEASACTEIAYNAAIGDWVCIMVEVNPRHLPVIEPKAYDGPCADAVADQIEGRWVCHGNTPLPPSDLPSTRVYATQPMGPGAGTT